MEFTPKAIFFCAADSARNERLSQEVGKFLSEQPIYRYVLSFPCLNELNGVAESYVSERVSRLKGKGDIQLSAEIDGRALRLVNIIVALGQGKEESNFAGHFDRILSLTQFPIGQASFNVLITDNPIRQLRARTLQIIFARAWEQGLKMEEDEYAGACATLACTLALIPTADDINRFVFGTTSRIVSAYAHVTRVPEEADRRTLTAMFRRRLADKIETEEQDFAISDLIAASLNTKGSNSLAVSDTTKAEPYDSQISTPHVRIKLFSSGGARERYLRDRLELFHSRKAAYLGQLLAQACTQRERVWREPVAQEAEARVHARLESAVRSYRLGALGRELEQIERELRDTIQEPTTWHFIRDMRPLTCTAFPFTRFWVGCFLVILAFAVGSIFPLSNPAFQIAVWGSAMAYWPLLLLTGFLRLRRRSFEIESAMRGNMGTVPTFVEQNSKNFETARMNFLRRILLRLVGDYLSSVKLLRQRISEHEYCDERDFQQGLAGMRATLNDSAFDKLESYMCTGVRSGLDNALKKTDLRFVAESDSPETVFREALREFVSSLDYQSIAGLFLEHKGEDMLRRLTSRQQLPCGLSKVESDPNLRRRFVLSPVPSREVSRVLKQGGAEIEGRVLTVPASDSWIVVHVAPIAE